MDYVFPKWGIRELGFNAPLGKLSAINAIVIIFLVPMRGALTQKFAAYRMVVIGGAICAAGVFIMALPTEWFQPAAESGVGQWLGHGDLGIRGSIHPYYLMAALYLIVFSIGEAFYSPRVYEYAAAIAPKRTGSIVRLIGVPSIPRWQNPCRSRRMVAGCVLSRTRSAALRNDVVYFCSGSVRLADWIGGAAPLHSRPGSRPARLIGKMAYDKSRKPGHFLACLRNSINEDRSCACTICQRRRLRVDCLALSRKSDSQGS